MLVLVHTIVHGNWVIERRRKVAGINIWIVHEHTSTIMNKERRCMDSFFLV